VSPSLVTTFSYWLSPSDRARKLGENFGWSRMRRRNANVGRFSSRDELGARDIESLAVRPAIIPGPGSLAKNEGGTRSVCSALWTAVQARPGVFSASGRGCQGPRNPHTFSNLARKTKLEAVSRMNERMQEARQEPVKHLRMFFALVIRAFYIFHIFSGKIGVEVGRRRQDEAFECFVRSVVAKIFGEVREI